VDTVRGRFIAAAIATCPLTGNLTILDVSNRTPRVLQLAGREVEDIHDGSERAIPLPPIKVDVRRMDAPPSSKPSKPSKASKAPKTPTESHVPQKWVRAAMRAALGVVSKDMKAARSRPLYEALHGAWLRLEGGRPSMDSIWTAHAILEGEPEASASAKRVYRAVRAVLLSPTP
jgi:hypothetical protein